MQNVIYEIRQKLEPFTNAGAGSHAEAAQEPRISNAYVKENRGNLIYKIPRKNYDALSKTVPISWL